MKRVFLLLTIVSFVALSCSGGGSSTSSSDSVRIGGTLYRFDDTFISTVRDNVMARNAESGSAASINFADGQGQQATQNDSIDTFIAQGYDVLAVNMVDRTSAEVIIQKAQSANIPVVFFNREPLAEDMAAWENLYYVGAKAEESGRIQGEIIADYFAKNSNADKNGDGVVQYVMLTGEPGHQDALLRTEHSVAALEAAGYKTQKLAEDTGMWQRVNGQEKMAAWLAAHGDNIEVVFANNDDMALGAIEALKAAGYFEGDKYMPVVGVDATAPALDSIENGLLYASVLNDSKGQGYAIYDISLALGQGSDPKATLSYDFVDGNYVWVPYVAVTQENFKDFK